MDIGSRLKTLRAGLSQWEFSERIGFNKNTVGNYERGERTPDVDFLKAVCEQFDVSPEWLLWGKGPMRRGESLPEAPQVMPSAAPQAVEEDWKMSDMLTKTAEVLESDTIYRTALASNINAFHQAVRSERILAKLEERVAVLEAKLDGMAQIDARMTELERENADLRRRLERVDENTDKAVGADG